MSHRSRGTARDDGAYAGDTAAGGGGGQAPRPVGSGARGPSPRARRSIGGALRRKRDRCVRARSRVRLVRPDPPGARRRHLKRVLLGAPHGPRGAADRSLRAPRRAHRSVGRDYLRRRRRTLADGRRGNGHAGAPRRAGEILVGRRAMLRPSSPRGRRGLTAASTPSSPAAKGRSRMTTIGSTRWPSPRRLASQTPISRRARIHAPPRAATSRADRSPMGPWRPPTTGSSTPALGSSAPSATSTTPGTPGGRSGGTSVSDPSAAPRRRDQRLERRNAHSAIRSITNVMANNRTPIANSAL